MNKAYDYATTSMILGICSCVGTLVGFAMGIFIILSFIVSIVGICFSSKAKQLGCCNGQQKAGFVTSIIALCITGIFMLFLVLALIFAVKLMI